MITLYLVRHGTAENRNDVLYGRMPGTHLSARGLEEVRDLARGFAPLAIDALIASPLERTRQTAAPIAEACGLEVELDEALLEVDFGDWTGLPFTELRRRDDWQRWNAARSLARAPGGERMQDVVARARACIDRLAERRPDGRVVVVTHGDVVRGLLVDFLGMSMDHIYRLEITPASVSTVELYDRDCRLLGVNRRPGAAVPPPRHAPPRPDHR